MEDIVLLETAEKIIVPKELMDKTKSNPGLFQMFRGKERRVTLKVDNSLIDAMLDRFGLNLSLWKQDENSFCIQVMIQTSPTFFGWLTQFGNKIKILAPEELAIEFSKELGDIISNYHDAESVAKD